MIQLSNNNTIKLPNSLNTFSKKEWKYFTVRCAVHLLLIKNGKVLVELRKNRDYYNGQYDVIAAHLAGGLDIYDSIIFTAKREVNITINSKDLVPIQVMHHNSDGVEYIHYFFIAHKYKGKLKNNEPNYCERLDWVEFKYPIPNLIYYINEAIKNYTLNPQNKFTTLGFK